MGCSAHRLRSVDRRQRTTLIIAITAQAAVSVVQFGMPAIALQIRDRLDLGPAGFGAVFAAIGLGSAVVLLPTGMLVDRFGARRVLAAGALLNLAGYAVATTTTDPRSFAAATFVAGIGSAAVPVAGMSALLREFPPAKRGIALGWRQFAVPLGGTIGSVALPLLAHAGGVQLALAVAATCTTATALTFAILMPGGGGEVARLRLDGVLSAPGMRTVLLVALLYAFALSATLTYIVSAARDSGLDATSAGLLFLIVNVSAAASRLVWGRIADLAGGTRRLRTLAETGAVSAAAAAAIPLALRAGLLPAAFAACVLAFGAFGFNGVLYVTAGELVGPERAGRAVGIASTMVFGATSLASPLAGLVAEHAGYDTMWLAAAVSSACGAMVALRGVRVRAVCGPAAEQAA
jgi:MFS family permease